tara:strand:- start:5 stop:2206 length:2202 start_codon:yes stop_codon:yes gene_type:complete
MVKRLIQIIIILVLLFISFCLYLSIYGLNTNKFNDLISKKISERNKNFTITFDKIKIFLDIGSFNLEIKTDKPSIIFQDKEIKIKSISTSLPIKSIIKKQNNINNIKIITDENKIKNIIEIARSLKNTPELFLLNKAVKSGIITSEIKFNFGENGNLLSDFILDGRIENLNLKLINNNTVDEIKLNFLIRDKKYLFYNSSLNYQGIKITSNEIRVVNSNNIYSVEGDLSNNSSNINLNKLFKILNIDIKLKDKDLLISSTNDFSFDLNKKFKFSGVKVQSNIDYGNFEYSNVLLKRFFPGYRENIKFQDNKLKVIYNNENYQVSGNSKFNINEDIDNLKFDISKRDDKIFFNTTSTIKNNAINFKILNYTKKKNLNSTINLDGIIYENKSLLINEIKFAQKENYVNFKNISLNPNKKVESIDEINISVQNNNENISKLKIKKNKNNYLIDSDIFDATSLVDEILFSKKDGNFLEIFDSLNSLIKINVKEIYISKNDYLENLITDIDIKLNKINNLMLSSKFPNNSELKLSITKNSNDEKITTLNTKNASPLVKKYKFIKGFEGGSLDFYSTSKNGYSKSNLNINDFKLKEVPALTKLLTLASLQGIADLLTGEGIRFNEFEMKFNNNNGLMTIEEIYSLGPSISILMDGYVQKDDLISLRGTLVPATTINKVIGSIPLLGDILVGKKTGEGVFGVSFKIKGYPKDLKTTVNPIKTLTPRFITRTLENLKKTRK